MNIKMRDLKHVGGVFLFLSCRTQRELMWLAVPALSLPFLGKTLLKQLAHGLFDLQFPLTFLFGAAYRSCWKLATFIGVDK